MGSLQETIAAAIARLMDRARSLPGLAPEIDRARGEFFGERSITGKSPMEPVAEARFEEWFLFERRAPQLGDVPVFVALAPAVAEKAPAAIRELIEELGENHYGVFELGEEGGAATLRDLLSQRQRTLDPEQAEWLAGSMEPGAVFVGRIFSTGRGTHVLGRGAVAVRGEVALALRGDLGKPDRDRRQRLSQVQMERLLFFDAASPAAGAVGAGGAEVAEGGDSASSPEPIERIEAEVESWLRSSGAQGVEIDDLRERFLQTPAVADAVEPFLEEMAFETEADLDVGRKILPNYHRALHADALGGRAPVEAGRAPDELRARAAAACECGSGKAYGDCCLPRDAVARFEGGRLRGESLERLFNELQAAMGLEAFDDDDQESEELEAGPTLGPIVDEYLWESEKLGRPRPARGAAFLRELAASVDAGPGSPSDLGEVLPAHFERFISFDRYRHENPPASDPAGEELSELGQFAAWVRDEQGVDWLSFLSPIVEREATSRERLSRANGRLGAGDLGRRTGAFAVTRVTRRGDLFEAELETISKVPARGRVDLPKELVPDVEPGDCVVITEDRVRPSGASRADKHAAGADGERTIFARLLRILPAGARPFLAGSIPSRESGARADDSGA